MASVRNIEQSYKDWKAGKLTAYQFELVYGFHPSLYPQRFKESAERVKRNEQEDKEAEQAKNKAAASTFSERQLSLQEGYTGIDKLAANPPFDPRITALTLGDVSSVLQRGQMVQSSFYASARSQPAPYCVNFLYNPSSIGVSYAGSDQFLPSDLLTSDQNAAQAFAGMQTIAFDLLFDRTYEVAYLDRPHPTMAAYRDALAAGVYADIRALERVVGIQNGNGPIQPIAIDVYFGAILGSGDKTKTYKNKRGQVITEVLGPNITSRPLGFFGYVTGMDVTYTHFSHTMTPMRATVNLQMSQVFRDSTRPGGVGVFYEEDAKAIEEGK